jgi:serine phosphatase RsbU (regulator of sigma subunit)
MLIVEKRKKISPELFILIPFVALSLQNAYMYSVMDVESFQKHTFAYIALFIGAGMMVLWKPVYTIGVVVITLLANIITFSLFSNLTLDQILINGGLLTGTVAIFTILLINTRYNLTKKEIIARLALADSNKQLEFQKGIIEEKNKDITDSIKYARRIQEAILPQEHHLKQVVPNIFVLYKPKDIVSGDFYWFSQKGDNVLIAAGDCTGHGVPGALMSMLGSSFLNEIVNEREVLQPSRILDEVKSKIISILNQRNSELGSKDGMDIALINLDLANNKLQYAGAFNPFWVIRNGELIEIKADKFPIGNYAELTLNKFTNHNFDLLPGDRIYLFTDGYSDQFGGPMKKKFKYRQFKDLLISLPEGGMETQKNILNRTIEDWKGDLEQVDDILVIGIRI